MLQLSDRELQIIQCVFDGMKELAVAQTLGISAHTVHAHVKRLYRKLGVGNHCELLTRVFAAYVALASGDESRPSARRRPDGPMPALDGP